MKRIISLAVAGILVLMCFGNCFTVSANGERTQMQNLLSSLSIMQGDENGDFCEDDMVTRAEFAKIAVTSSKHRNSVTNHSTVSPFSDVKFTHWGAPYIKVASSNGLVSGYPDGSFRPENGVLLEEGVTICLKLLGYEDIDFGSSWPSGQMSLATELGLLDGIEQTAGYSLKRADVMDLIYNTLNTELKNSQSKAITSFGYNVLSDTVLIATTNEVSTVARNKIVTSSGTYNISDSFDKTLVGLKGDLVLKNSQDAIAFFPGNQLSEEYSVYTVLNNEVLVYDNGQTKKLDVSSDTLAYKGTASGTVNSFISQINQGDSLSVYNNYLGDAEYVIIGAEKLKGPYTVKSPSIIKNTYNLSNDAVFMRNGKVVSASAIEVNDIIYISNAMDLVWAYSNKVTGIYESALPNKDNVSQIILSGVTYDIESSDAFNKLVTGGACELGDRITVLLGKDGKVADVVTNQAETVSVYGYLTDAGTKEYVNSNGNKYTSYYVTVTDAEGNSLDYKTSSDYSELKSSVVNVKITADRTSVSFVQGTKVSGRFNWSDKVLGDYNLSENLKIMDVMNTSVAKSPEYTLVHPSRLDDVVIGTGKVLYHTVNKKGEIDNLFLDNITGDGYSYGIITDVNGNSYTANVNGQITSFGGGGTTYSVKSGEGARFTMKGQGISSASALHKVNETVKSFDGYQLVTDENTYILSDKVVCYERPGVGEWQLTSLTEIQNKKTGLIFYYDKSPEVGGRIRVIISY